VFHISLPPICTPFPYTTLFRSAFHIVFDPEQKAGDKLAPLLLARVKERGGRRLEASRDDLFHQVDGQLLVAPSKRQRHHTDPVRSEEHTSELQSRENLVCRLLL